MSVRFVIGRAGSGKTRHCFDAIVKELRADPLGPPILWILPKQATFSAERELTCDSGLGGFCRARVVSFEQLGHDILSECGGAAIPAVNALGRQMLLGHLLRQLQPDLKFFKAVARQPGLAAMLDQAFAEFERCGKDPAAIGLLTDQLQSASPDDLHSKFLVDKLHDFHALYAAYSNFLGQERLDPQQRLNHVLSCLSQWKQLRGAKIFVDAFLDFTDYERRILAALGDVCEHVEITMLAEPDERTFDLQHHLDEMHIFHRTTEQLRKLAQTMAESAVKMDPPLMLKKTLRFAHNALSAVEANQLFGESDAVRFIEAPDRRGEVDTAARAIRELMRDGKRLREIGVLVRDLDLYHELITASFGEHGIPFFVDRRRTAVHHPLIQFVRAVLQIARNDWPQDSVMTLLKSGLAGVSLDEADELENYVLLHRIRGPAWASREPWKFNRTLTREPIDELSPREKVEVERIDRLRRQVVEKVLLFVDRQRSDTVRSVRQTIADLFQLFENLQVRQTIAKWMQDATDAQLHEQHDEHEQVWTELVQMLDQLADLLGDERVELEDFIDTLEAGLESFDLALTPATIDQVLVGQVDRTRTPRLDTAIVLGLNEGTFPRTSREDSVLSDGERRVLQRRGVDVDPDSTRRLLDENLHGYLAFTRASHRLIVTRPVADDGGKRLAESVFWRRLRELFPQNEVEVIERGDRDLASNVGTPRQLVTMLMRWAREFEPDAAASAKPQAAMYSWLASRKGHDDAIDVMRYRAWRALSYVNIASLSKEVAAKFFTSPLRASVTRIETFATCPFKHFLQFGLRLQPRVDDDVTPMDLGNVFHGILERIVREILEQRTDFCELQPDDAQRLIHDYAEQVGAELRGELMLSSARNKYLLQRIEKTLSQVIATQRAALVRGKFRPAFAELGFGIDGSTLPAFELKTPSGRRILLSGKIDRVDLIEAEGQFAVIDYKLTGSQLALDRVYHGLSLQLLTYLLVLEASGEALAKKKLTPVAAFYMRLLRKLDEVKHPDQACSPDDPAFDLQNVKPRGIFDAKFLREIDSTLTDGPSDVVAAYVKKDGEFGRVDSSDHVATDQFASLLKYVRNQLAKLGDKMLDGEISITPFRLGQETPCPRCDFCAVCRFEVGVNRYQMLESLKRTEVLERVSE